MRNSTAPRIAHDATVTVEGEAHHPFAARAVNLSVGGMFVESETLLSPGAQVALKVELRDGGAAVDAQGEVVWVRDGASEPPGMALRFVGLDETSTRRIGRVVAAGRREPSALFKRDVRIRLAALPAPLRAVARDQSEEGLILEAELPWLKLGSEVTAELAPGQTRTGRVRWVGLDVTRAGSARLRILVDLAERAERDRPRAPAEGSPEPPVQVARLALAPEPAAEPAPRPLAQAPAAEPAAPRAPLEVAPTVPSETAPAARPRHLLRNLILALVLIAPALVALWLTTSTRPAPALMPPSVVAQPAAARPAPARVELPTEQPAPDPAPAPAAHHRHHHHR